MRGIIVFIALIQITVIIPIKSFAQEKSVVFDITGFYQKLNDEKELPKKIEHCNQALGHIKDRLDPFFSSVLSMKAVINLETGNFKEAEIVSEDLLKVYDNYNAKYFKDTVLLSPLGKKAYVAHKKNIVETYCILASAKSHLQKYSEALHLANYSLKNLYLIPKKEHKEVFFNICYGVIMEYTKNNNISNFFIELERIKILALKDSLFMKNNQMELRFWGSTLYDSFEVLLSENSSSNRLNDIALKYRYLCAQKGAFQIVAL